MLRENFAAHEAVLGKNAASVGCAPHIAVAAIADREADGARKPQIRIAALVNHAPAQTDNRVAVAHAALVPRHVALARLIAKPPGIDFHNSVIIRVFLVRRLD
jgi:hypothetical protein